MAESTEAIPEELRDPLIETLTVQAQHLVTENRSLREQLGFVKYELDQARATVQWQNEEIRKLRQTIQREGGRH